MNRQGPKGIEWTEYTWNPISGCFHGCQWQMPDGSIARCYAHDIAEGLAKAAYPQGFEFHYWHPRKLSEPQDLKIPARIFLDSMSDLFGAWISDEQIFAVLHACKKAHWHTFQSLTKNPGRLERFAGRLPANLWAGVSMPPTWMNRRRLTQDQQERYMLRTFQVLATLKATEVAPEVVWLSLEPLSWDVGSLLQREQPAIDWIVIGAASNGKTKYQPAPEHVETVLDWASQRGVPVFMKGNLDWPDRQENLPITGNVG